MWMTYIQCECRRLCSREELSVLIIFPSDNKEDPSLLDDNSLSLQLKVASETDIEIR